MNCAVNQDYGVALSSHAAYLWCHFNSDAKDCFVETHCHKRIKLNCCIFHYRIKLNFYDLSPRSQAVLLRFVTKDKSYVSTNCHKRIKTSCCSLTLKNQFGLKIFAT